MQMILKEKKLFMRKLKKDINAVKLPINAPISKDNINMPKKSLSARKKA